MHYFNELLYGCKPLQFPQKKKVIPTNHTEQQLTETIANQL
jgi:hypothetical protein